MFHRRSLSKKIFDTFNYTFLLLSSILCLLPFVNLMAVSFSESPYVNAGLVTFWPVEFTLSAYAYILESGEFIRSFLISIIRVLLGVSINILLIVMTAYPLSKSNLNFNSRNLYAWFFVVSMLFTPSLIPSYLVVANLNLIDTIWSLVLPGALQVFSMIVMLNFFRNLPKELEEAAFIDGASHWKLLWKVFIPLSLPAIATVTLFSIVYHWNSWFDGILYIDNHRNYPMQSYLQSIIINPTLLNEIIKNDPNAAEIMLKISNQTVKAAQLFVATIPVLVIYPFLQKYFTTGLTLGSVKE
jgi:putative aldouronate transport system permease protein